MFSLFFLVLVSGAWFLKTLIASFQYYRPAGFPSGPLQLPVVGNLFFFRKSPLIAMMSWKKIYGKIVGIRLGDFRAIILNDYDLIKEAFNNDAFNGRPEFLPAHLFTGGESHGTLTSEGDSWDTIRRFTIKNLNNLGFGRKTMEGFIQDDIYNLISSLRKELCGPVDFKDKVYVTATSHLWYILVGQEIPLAQRDYFQKLLINLNHALWKPIGSSIWFLPWMTKLFPSATGLVRLKTMLPPVQQLVENQVTEHLLNGKNENTSENLMDAFLSEIKKMEGDPNSHFHNQNGHNHMRGMILNLFVTAAETITNSINWSLLYLSLYPDVQEKLFREIFDVIGATSMPSFTDRPNLPYTKAVMQEVLRISSTCPFSNFHLTTQDVHFHGHFIPKDTIVIANLYGIHHDDNFWGDPECFRPERFLESSSCITPLIPFSVGLRTCIGQTFAKNEFFLLLVSLVQQFSFQWDPQVPRPSQKELTEKSQVSVFRFSMPFKLILKEREFL